MKIVNKKSIIKKQKGKTVSQLKRLFPNSLNVSAKVFFLFFYLYCLLKLLFLLENLDKFSL